MPPKKGFGNASVSFKLKPGIDKELKKRFLAGQIRGGQEVVATAAKNHPYKDQRGHNTRSIGWTVSGSGKSSFGPATTQGNGSQGSAGISDNAGNITVAVVTTSGYGGYLEVGTGRMRPFPYLTPAFEANKEFIKKQLTGIY